MKIIIDKKFHEIISKEFPEIQFYTEPDQCPEALALIGQPEIMNVKILEKLPNLKWIQLFRAGYDMIDTDYIRKRGITLTNGKDIFSIPIAEDVVCKILMHNTNALRYLENKKVQMWDNTLRRTELKGQTVGIIGTGSIAMEIAKRLQPFGVKMLGYKRTPVLNVPYFEEIYSGKRGLDHIMSVSDYIIVTADLNEETYHMINKENLKLMKETASVINIARGSIINQKDLKDALKNKLISYAGLDVFEIEPLPSDDELWSMDNVYLTPHASALVKNNKARWVKLIVQNIKNFADNERLINIIM
ncbi:MULTISPECIES: D-2-hydroxyacid dehydrogenase [unclassified Sedimentibacter]|uniref:D-2-hydroxyacid dehydrogenase n=1 Tax=unclassified Sedimentibacter TaxID=2649220 RepID=UPI0027DF43F5|nr:D-2-hydroxyacid dehydrogenase [Sedimentibacter sp. MB35-C1]WMJ77612.1 D-2-hydroxyacid dehydrogenase [Sedimentibacter sp. MB35-C1]